ncbi:hypothetical protein KKD70_00395 [Patescibacteria group bacterium]|nr:hypothetical protein [Patescibacteria group bacterium]
MKKTFLTLFLLSTTIFTVGCASQSSNFLTYLSSSEDPLKYCDGEKMDSEEYKKTITSRVTTDTIIDQITKDELAKAKILAATSGQCNSVLEQTDVRLEGDTAYIGQISGWAGSSIVMCSCHPEIEVNLLDIDGINNVIFEGQETVPTAITTPTTTSTTTSETPGLSADKKSIIVDSSVLLSVDNDAIFNWFKTESQLCDGYNLTSTSDRKAFCEDLTSFKSQTRFASIVISPDKMEIGFTIESDTLSPDKVVGIFLRSANKVNLLTNYYLGNEFISFSPGGENFVYQGGCWEGLCGLFIKDSETLTEVASLNNPEYLDLRSVDAEFVRWLSENQVEYKLGAELKQESF